MKGILLDTNLLVAIFWPAHEAHRSATQWFERNASKGWATCPITQCGVVRILCNPAFSPFALSRAAASSLLAENLADPAHQFWPDHLGIAEALAPFQSRVHGHRQITDAYLLGLAHHWNGQFATLDRGIRYLLPPDFANRKLLIEVGA